MDEAVLMRVLDDCRSLLLQFREHTSGRDDASEALRKRATGLIRGIASMPDWPPPDRRNPERLKPQ